jgi:hypothetical protein
MRRAGGFAVVFFATTWIAGAAQMRRDGPASAELGTARIAGTVLAIDGGSPAAPGRRAIVTLTGAALPIGQSVVTDDHGRFVLERLPAGRFMLTATKPAYLQGSYGATRPGRPGVPIVLSDAARLSDVTITLTRGAAISGTIRDPEGAPLFGVGVSALRALPDGSLVTVATGATDDRGAYRLFGLAAGSYLISASRSSGIGTAAAIELTSAQIDRKLAQLQSRSARSPASLPNVPSISASTSSFVPVFHPRAFSPADATPVAVASGDDRHGTDIVLDRARSVALEGVVSGAPSSATLTIAMTQSPSTPTAPILRSRPPGDGPFGFTNVTPGRYRVTARTPVGVEPLLFARADVEVGNDDARGVALAMQPALHFTGRIVFDATRLAPPADLTAIHVMLEDAAPPSAPTGAAGGGRAGRAPLGSTTDARGNFDVAGVLPGTYRVSTSFTSSSTGWWLRSASVNGRDVLDAPLEVGLTPVSGAVLTFSDRHTVLSGQLEVPAARVAAEYFIVVFPADRTAWLPRARRIQSTRPGTDATYVFRDLPPGAYRLAALTDVTPDDLSDPVFFETVLPASIPVTLGEGEQKTQALKVLR